MHKFIFIFFILIFSSHLKASHIVGGELNYRCLGNNEYEISLTIYRDCFFGNPQAWFDNPASIGFFDKDNQLVRTIGINGELRMVLMNNDTLDPTLVGTCFVVPPTVCVHTTTYIDTITLPFLEGGYQLAYQRCCRNETIQNIVLPQNTGATYSVNIGEEALRTCNSNAKFNNWPPIFICVNEPIVFDHSATDSEGDSLVYRLCTPLTGASPGDPLPRPPGNPPYIEVAFAPGFTLNNILGGIPLRIDSKTGVLTGTPAFMGQFVVGVCVDEFRDDSLISVTRRDFQYNIGVCGMTSSAFFTPDTSCSLQLNIINQSIDTDSASWMIRQNGNLIFTSNTYHLNYTFPAEGIYNIMLIANPGSNCADTIDKNIQVFDSKLQANFSAVQSGCKLPVRFDFEDLSVDPDHAFMTDSFVVIVGNMRLKLDTMPDFLDLADDVSNVTFILYLQNEVGCKDTFLLVSPVFLLEEPIVPDTLNICFGLTLDVTAYAPDSGYTIHWDPESVILSGQGTQQVTIFTETDIWVFAEISGPNNCLLQDSVFINVTEEIQDFTVVASPAQIYASQFSNLDVLIDGNFQFNWSPAGSLNSNVIQNPIASPVETTRYFVTVTDEAGCTKVGSVVVEILQFDCDSNFVFIPNMFTPNQDNVNDYFNVRSNVLSSYELIVYDRWGKEVFRTNSQDNSWDGTFEGEDAMPGAYGYHFRGICLDQQEYIKKGSITLIR